MPLPLALATILTVSQSLEIIASCDPNNPHIRSACDALNEISLRIANVNDSTSSERNSLDTGPDEVWEKLDHAWRALALQLADENYGGDACQRNEVISLARFTRNVVAGNSVIQSKVYPCEPHLRSVAHLYSSQSFMHDSEDSKAARFVLQAISNTVTANDTLSADLWAKYINLPEDESILRRFVVHPDDTTCNVVLVFILNCISKHRSRMFELVKTYGGHRLCVAVLDRLSSHVEESDENSESRLFQSGWTIFENLLLNDLGPLLFDTMEMEEQVITPPQTTLMKLVDAFIMEAGKGAYRHDDRTECSPATLIDHLTLPLRRKYFTLIGYARSSLEASVGESSATKTDHTVLAEKGAPTRLSSNNDIRSNARPGDTERSGSFDERQFDSDSGLRQIDVILPRVCEAIVLITQCFCNITLYQGPEFQLLDLARDQKALLCSARSSNISNDGLLESVIELLRLLDLFLPRVMFGKASWSTPRPQGSPMPPAEADRGFNFLKRDLVRLVGILCFENSELQNRIRSCGGVLIIMNMCVTDERNPYLREHALFTMRNLLRGNEANQSLVRELEPMGVWDEGGVLHNVPRT